MEENGFHQPESQFPLARIISFVLKNWSPLIAVTVSASRKKLSSKVTISIREKNANEGFIQKYVSTRQKINLSPAGLSEKIYKKWFGLACKSFSTIRNEAFVENYVSTIHKICFFSQEDQSKWFPLAGKCFSFKIDFPYWSATAEKKL